MIKGSVICFEIFELFLPSVIAPWFAIFILSPAHFSFHSFFFILIKKRNRKLDVSKRVSDMFCLTSYWLIDMFDFEIIIFFSGFCMHAWRRLFLPSLVYWFLLWRKSKYPWRFFLMAWIYSTLHATYITWTLHFMHYVYCNSNNYNFKSFFACFKVKFFS